MKKAVLAVSFGTACESAVLSCIRPVEDALAAAFPDRELRRAFSSRILVRRLRERGVFIETEAEALARLKDEGFSEILVVPTHIVPGREYEKVRSAAAGLRVSPALLSVEDDAEWMAGLLAGIAEEEAQPLLVMGHGTGCAADAMFSLLRRKLPGNVFLACREGDCTLRELLPVLKRSVPEGRISLMPLMLTAGRHAQTELAGDGEDSWKSVLEAEGYEVRIRMQGLGGLEAVRRRFVEKALRTAGE